MKRLPMRAEELIVGWLGSERKIPRMGAGPLTRLG
jgi:hypothetical protein